MKLKLPLALLTALAACMVSAQETTETTYLHTQIPEGTIPVYEKAIGTDTQDYTVKIKGNYGTSWHVNAQELTWNRSHAYESGRPINVGSALLENAVYNFDTVQTMALALEADVAAGTMTYEVTKANFEMQGTNLSWTGTVKGIHEPSTATLSLLALAGLAARRRRK